MMPDCRFEEYFLPDTPETTFGDETLWYMLLRPFKTTSTISQCPSPVPPAAPSVHRPWCCISNAPAMPATPYQPARFEVSQAGDPLTAAMVAQCGGNHHQFGEIAREGAGPAWPTK